MSINGKWESKFQASMVAYRIPGWWLNHPPEKYKSNSQNGNLQKIWINIFEATTQFWVNFHFTRDF